jgi:uncharacterized membrane protein YeaQ/YmgE (transglycosylase-associated protein family)
MAGILKTMGMNSMAGFDFWLVWVMMGVIAMMTAWIADNVMEKFAFGIIGNTLLLLAGMTLGLYAMGSYGIVPSRLTIMTAVPAAAAGAVAVLLLACSIKRYF